MSDRRLTPEENKGDGAQTPPPFPRRPVLSTHPVVRRRLAHIHHSVVKRPAAANDNIAPFLARLPRFIFWAIVMIGGVWALWG